MSDKFGKLKALVVEDSKVAIRAITGYLEEIGVHPMVAETGGAAVELYRKERPDIILLDIILPDIDGFEVAKQIRRLQGKDDWTAIIFLSVMSKDEDLARGIQAGGDDYLMKPVGRGGAAGQGGCHVPSGADAAGTGQIDGTIERSQPGIAPHLDDRWADRHRQSPSVR